MITRTEGGLCLSADALGLVCQAWYRKMVRFNLRYVVNWSLGNRAPISIVLSWSVRMIPGYRATWPKTARWRWSRVLGRSGKRRVLVPAPQTITI